MFEMSLEIQKNNDFIHQTLVLHMMLNIVELEENENILFM